MGILMQDICFNRKGAGNLLKKNPLYSEDKPFLRVNVVKILDDPSEIDKISEERD
jgi:hypothetical protein